MADNQMIYELLIEMKHEMSSMKREITGINERLGNLEITVNRIDKRLEGVEIQLAKVSEEVNENNKIKKLFSEEALGIVS